MPEFTVHYFPLFGRAGPIDMLLSKANADYEMNVITFQDWPGLKASMPYTHVPCLELADGTKMGQTNAIMRFLGKKYGFYPTDPMDAYMVD